MDDALNELGTLRVDMCQVDLDAEGFVDLLNGLLAEAGSSTAVKAPPLCGPVGDHQQVHLGVCVSVPASGRAVGRPGAWGLAL